jgi:hypothetical protein
VPSSRASLAMRGVGIRVPLGKTPGIIAKIILDARNTCSELSQSHALTLRNAFLKMANLLAPF